MSAPVNAKGDLDQLLECYNGFDASFNSLSTKTISYAQKHLQPNEDASKEVVQKIVDNVSTLNELGQAINQTAMAINSIISQLLQDTSKREREEIEQVKKEFEARNRNQDWQSSVTTLNLMLEDLKARKAEPLPDISRASEGKQAEEKKIKSGLEQIFDGCFSILVGADQKKFKSYNNRNIFRLSLLPQVQSGGDIAFGKLAIAPLKGFEKLPQLCVYDDPLYLSENAIVVQLPPNMLFKHVPIVLLDELNRIKGVKIPAGSEINYRELSEKMYANQRVEFFVMASTPPKRFNDKANEFEVYQGDAHGTRTYNLFYHVWAFDDYEPACDIPMGIFSPVGVEGSPSLSIPVNRIDNVGTCLHPSDNLYAALSPNNARLQLKAGDTFHSFWSVAAHKDRVIVVFHNILSSAQEAEALRKIAAGANNLGQLFERL